ncbi:hypothetical protein JTE90_005974 [Oedothorax gibbosus]|uniref:Uncharacterized protein n=1 Tax=Oedothorax gibbosus TaxID=931172 RepID=A0AAV6UY79_9ARAC|nr:hypothetical protein JTE90_005974 [Oedothorax gibbosus]
MNLSGLWTNIYIHTESDIGCLPAKTRAPKKVAAFSTPLPRTGIAASFTSSRELNKKKKKKSDICYIRYEK